MQKNTLGFLSCECSMKLIPSQREQPLSIKELTHYQQEIGSVPTLSFCLP